MVFAIDITNYKLHITMVKLTKDANKVLLSHPGEDARLGFNGRN
jgi:hypothetical protein